MELPLHALVLPLPAQGHINPMLHLSSQLALRGSTITFVNTERSHNSMLQSRSESDAPSALAIRFVTIPDGLPDDWKLDSSVDTLLQILEGIEKQRGLLVKLIESSKANGHPISCIISDLFFPWTQDLANQLGIARVLFWASNVTSLYVDSIAVRTGKSDRNGMTDDLPTAEREILSYFGNPVPEHAQSAKRRFEGIDDTACILVNSFEELESPFLAAVPLNTPIKCVGPLFSPGSEAIDVNIAGSLLKEELGCLRWLNMQAPSSVLYISFGSVAFSSPAQIEQLALGIEASKQRFLWVVRPGGAPFPEGFVERTQEQGLIISWAPQLRVLEHPAIGCFLTHCGWNSTLESIMMGVPMLCCPLFADQPANEMLIVKQWKVGKAFEKREDGVVDKGEVEKVVMAVMRSEEGRELRDGAARWKEAARKAAGEGGSSQANLSSFISDMVRLRDSKTLG